MMGTVDVAEEGATRRRLTTGSPRDDALPALERLHGAMTAGIQSFASSATEARILREPPVPEASA